MKLRDYVAQRKAELDSFESDWFARMLAEPKDYDFDQASYSEWKEQEEAFNELSEGEI